MTRNNSYRIETKAAQALAEWKALFAEQVSGKAKELAEKDSTAAGVITLAHYHQAANIAVQMLATALQDTGINDGRQEAA